MLEIFDVEVLCSEKREKEKNEKKKEKRKYYKVKLNVLNFLRTTLQKPQ
jgi:hypothetical protein